MPDLAQYIINLNLVLPLLESHTKNDDLAADYRYQHISLTFYCYIHKLKVD